MANGGSGPASALGHGLVEDRGGLRVLGEVVEGAHAEDVIERGLSGPHAVEQAAPRPPHGLVDEQQRQVAHGARDPRAQQRSEGGQREAPGLDLVEHADDGEAAQQPAEGRRMVPVARASSSPLCAPSARSSAMPSRAAT